LGAVAELVREVDEISGDTEGGTNRKKKQKNKDSTLGLYFFAFKKRRISQSQQKEISKGKRKFSYEKKILAEVQKKNKKIL
ncbi:MAG: hypothetical protein LUE99_06895, partial [Bacteroides sp.]|nr:hypothetical protein [Bacteroides sp.]